MQPSAFRVPHVQTGRLSPKHCGLGGFSSELLSVLIGAGVILGNTNGMLSALVSEINDSKLVCADASTHGGVEV